MSLQENQTEGFAVEELQKRLGISISLSSHGIQIVEEFDDKELLDLASRLAEQKVSSNEQVSSYCSSLGYILLILWMFFIDKTC